MGRQQGVNHVGEVDKFLFRTFHRQDAFCGDHEINILTLLIAGRRGQFPQNVGACRERDDMFFAFRDPADDLRLCGCIQDAQFRAFQISGIIIQLADGDLMIFRLVMEADFQRLICGDGQRFGGKGPVGFTVLTFGGAVQAVRSDERIRALGDSDLRVLWKLLKFRAVPVGELQGEVRPARRIGEKILFRAVQCVVIFRAGLQAAEVQVEGEAFRVVFGCGFEELQRTHLAPLHFVVDDN